MSEIKLYDMQEVFDSMETSWSFKNAFKNELIDSYLYWNESWGTSQFEK